MGRQKPVQGPVTLLFTATGQNDIGPRCGEGGRRLESEPAGAPGHDDEAARLLWSSEGLRPHLSGSLWRLQEKN